MRELIELRRRVTVSARSGGTARGGLGEEEGGDATAMRVGGGMETWRDMGCAVEAGAMSDW